MRRFAFIAAAALAAWAYPAQARAYDFGSFCGGNGLSTCAAVQVWVDGGYLRIDVLNLSGFAGTPENTVFTKIGLDGMGITGAGNLQISFAGSAWESASPYNWNLVTNATFANLTADLAAVSDPKAPQQGVASECASTLPGRLDSRFITPGCADGAIDYTQAVSFRFTYTGLANIADGSVLLRGLNAGYGDDTGGSLVCDTSTNCVPSTVPEPATVILMATGLLGLGVVGYRRRRLDGIEDRSAEA